MPSVELMSVIAMAEEHVLRMDLHGAGSLTASNTIDEFSLIAPSDSLKKYAPCFSTLLF